MDIAVIKELLTVVAAVTGLSAPADDLTIRIMDSVEDIQGICQTNQEHVGGCFRSNNGKPTIYIWSYFKDADSKYAYRPRALLAHELTHYAQWYNGAYKNMPCQRYSEYQAYKVQNEVLRYAKQYRIPRKAVAEMARCG